MLSSIKPLLDKRFKDYGYYRFDTFIFNVFMVAIFGYIFFVAYSYNFNLDYFSCQDLTYCINPFYNPGIEWKTYRTLPPGEYGVKPGALFDFTWSFVFMALACAFVLNHFLYNKGKLRRVLNDLYRNCEFK